MEDFNLKKFLTENKLTRNSRLLNENIDVTDGEYVDENKIIKFLKDTMISKGYNLPEDFWLDMKENADFTIEDDEGYRNREYFENFDEDDALEEVKDYLEALLDYHRGYPLDHPYLQNITSIEDFKR